MRDLFPLPFCWQSYHMYAVGIFSVQALWRLSKDSFLAARYRFSSLPSFFVQGNCGGNNRETITTHRLGCAWIKIRFDFWNIVRKTYNDCGIREELQTDRYSWIIGCQWGEIAHSYLGGCVQCVFRCVFWGVFIVYYSQVVDVVCCKVLWWAAKCKLLSNYDDDGCSGAVLMAKLNTYMSSLRPMVDTKEISL